MTASDEKRSRLDFRVGEWVVHLNPRKGTFEILRAERDDLAHLTVMTKTESGKIHIHLTYGHEQAMARGDRKKERDTIAEISPDELNRVGAAFQQLAEERLIPRLISGYRSYRPGWLARSGYVVQVLERDVLLPWLKSAAPWKRGKYRLEPMKILDPENYPKELVGEYYDPRVLHLLEGWPREIPVSATRIRRGRIVDRDFLMLYWMIGPNGKPGWWGTPKGEQLSIHRNMVSEVFDWLVPLIRPHHGEKFEEIVRGLGLEELPELAVFLSDARAFFREPRNVLTHPFRKEKRAPSPS